MLKYAPFVSPYTMLSGRALNIDISLFEDISSGIRKRALMHDCTKSNFEFLAEGISDWLLLDVADIRFDIESWPQQDILLTCTSVVNQAQEKLKLIIGDEPKIYHCWEIPENTLYENLDKVISKILTIYRSEQIIFNEFYTVSQYIGNNGTLRNFREITRDISKHRNEVMKKANDYYKSRLKGCHIIKQPENLVAIEGHRWGLEPLHYHNLYYEYAEKCVDIITQKLERCEEARQIEFLRQLYSEKFAALREEAAHKSTALDRDKWRTYYERTEGELQSIKNSLSFRLGRMITFFPRKVRDAFKRKK